MNKKKLLFISYKVKDLDTKVGLERETPAREMGIPR